MAVAATVGRLRLGLTVCYDLRFPALYATLAAAGCNLIAVPSAFTRQTGEAHWHVLLRARAIECNAVVAAAAQAGRHENGRETYGHSLLVAADGEIIAEAGRRCRSNRRGRPRCPSGELICDSTKGYRGNPKIKKFSLKSCNIALP